MELASAQVIGAGLAAIGVGAAAAGVGNVFGSFLQGALRNPAAADGQQGRAVHRLRRRRAARPDGVRRGDDHPLRPLIAIGGGASAPPRRGEQCPRSTSFPMSSCRSCSGCCSSLASSISSSAGRWCRRSSRRSTSASSRSPPTWPPPSGPRPRPMRPRRPIAQRMDESRAEAMKLTAAAKSEARPGDREEGRQGRMPRSRPSSTKAEARSAPRAMPRAAEIEAVAAELTQEIVAKVAGLKVGRDEAAARRSKAESPMAEPVHTTRRHRSAAAPSMHEPTALGFDPGGWVALAMLVVFAILIWKKVPAAIGKALDKKIAADPRPARRGRGAAQGSRGAEGRISGQGAVCRRRSRGDDRARQARGRGDRRQGQGRRRGAGRAPQAGWPRTRSPPRSAPRSTSCAPPPPTAAAAAAARLIAERNDAGDRREAGRSGDQLRSPSWRSAAPELTLTAGAGPPRGADAFERLVRGFAARFRGRGRRG